MATKKSKKTTIKGATRSTKGKAKGSAKAKQSPKKAGAAKH